MTRDLCISVNYTYVTQSCSCVLLHLQKNLIRAMRNFAVFVTLYRVIDKLSDLLLYTADDDVPYDVWRDNGNW